MLVAWQAFTEQPAALLSEPRERGWQHTECCVFRLRQQMVGLVRRAQCSAGAPTAVEERASQRVGLQAAGLPPTCVSTQLVAHCQPAASFCCARWYTGAGAPSSRGYLAATVERLVTQVGVAAWCASWVLVCLAPAQRHVVCQVLLRCGVCLVPSAVAGNAWRGSSNCCAWNAQKHSYRWFAGEEGAASTGCAATLVICVCVGRLPVSWLMKAVHTPASAVRRVLFSFPLCLGACSLVAGVPRDTGC